MHEELIIALYILAFLLCFVVIWLIIEEWPEVRTVTFEARRIIEALKKRRTK